MNDSARFATLNGQFGFEVELPDGSVVDERSCTWADLDPVVKLRAVRLVAFSDGTRIVELRGCSEFFFSNHAAALIGGHGVMTAKVIGGVGADGQVEERRVEFHRDGAVVVAPAFYPRAQCPYIEAAFRRGAPP